MPKIKIVDYGKEEKELARKNKHVRKLHKKIEKFLNEGKSMGYKYKWELTKKGKELVDKHKIKLWSIPEVEDFLSSKNIPYKIKFGYEEQDDLSGVPIFILEGLKN